MVKSKRIKIEKDIWFNQREYRQRRIYGLIKENKNRRGYMV